MSEWIGLDEIKRRWSAAAEGGKNTVRYQFGRYLTFLLSYTRRNKLSGQVLGKYARAYDLSQGQVRWRKRPGNLKRALTANFVGELEADVLAPIYGAAWEHGFHRRSYFVKPVIAKALAWYGGGGYGAKNHGWAYSKGHTIHAQTFAAKPWMLPAYRETQHQFRNMVLLPLKRLLTGG